VKIYATILTCLTLSALELSGIESTQPYISPQDGSASRDEVCVDKHCKRGPRGHRGERGHKGHRGKIGSQGPTGPTGPAGASAVQSFAEAYISDSGGTRPFPTITFDPVDFNLEGVKSSDIDYDSSTKIFTLHTAGTYTIEYNVKASCPFSMEFRIDHIEVQVWINGVELTDRTTIVPGIFDATNGHVYAEATNQLTQAFTAGDTIQLRTRAFLNAEGTAFYGWPSQGVQQMAYISIEKIG
jgi:hypothetical protein